MKEFLKLLGENDFASLLQDYLGMTPGLLVNIIISLLAVLFLIIGRDFLTRKLTQNFKSEKLRELLQDSIPPVLKMIGVILLIKTWLTGSASLSSLLQLKENLIEQIAETIYIFLFYNTAKRVGNSIIHFKKFEDVQREYSLARTMQITLASFVGIYLFRIWIATTADLSTYLGLLSAGIAIALRDVIVSGAGWIYLVVVKPFSIGDRIEIDGKMGDVIDIQPLQFSVLELGGWAKTGLSTGRVMHFPNHFILSNVITNHNEAFDYVWAEMPILVTFESNWKKAYDLLDALLEKEVGRNNLEAQRQIRRASRQFKLFFPHLDSKVWVTVEDSGVLLTLRFLCDPKGRRTIESKIWQSVLELFSENGDIDFAYPTQRAYLNFKEAAKELQPRQ